MVTIEIIILVSVIVIITLVLLFIYKKLVTEVFHPVKRLSTKGFESIITSIHKLFKAYIPVMVQTLREQFERALYIKGKPLGEVLSRKLDDVYEGLQRNINNATQILTSLSDRFSKYQMEYSRDVNKTFNSLESLHNRVQYLEQQLTALEERLQSLSTRVDVIQTNLSTITNEIASLRHSLFDTTEALQRTMDKFEELASILSEINRNLFGVQLQIVRMERLQQANSRVVAKLASAITSLPSFEKVAEAFDAKDLALLKKMIQAGYGPGEASELLHLLEEFKLITPEEETAIELKLRKLKMLEAVPVL